MAVAVAAAAIAPPALADGEAGVRDLYGRFLAAQNTRDLAAVRATLWPSPKFLWVSDGRPFWGPGALIERMGAFQRAEVWRVDPSFERSRVVEVAPDAAFLSVPLVLTIGDAAAPAHLKWLVGVLCRRGGEGWRIAALFTTEDKGG
jgi:ketosteroid isomerase-like protein